MARKTFHIRNHYFFHDYYARLKNIALSVFKWEGLPDSCNARFLEDALFHYGLAGFAKDPTMGYMTLRATQSGVLNVYNEPLSYTLYGTGYNRIYDNDDMVLIRNNPIEKSTDSTLILYAEKLAVIDLAIQVNINAQKTPILIRCDERTRTSLEAIYAQYEGNKPVIFGTKGLQDKPLEVLATGAPFVSDKLRQEKSAVWNEALEFLGINTNPADKKKERLIVSEVESNNEQIDIQVATMFASRQRAAKMINEKYKGLNVEVKLRVEEFKTLWDYNLRLHGDVPDTAVQEAIKNGELLG